MLQGPSDDFKNLMQAIDAPVFNPSAESFVPPEATPTSK